MRRSNDSAVHFIGLLSDGGVHSHQRHLYALLKMAAQQKAGAGVCACVHGWARHLADRRRGLHGGSRAEFREMGVGKLASVSGRYYAMDRDLRWEKEHQAFDAMVTGHP